MTSATIDSLQELLSATTIAKENKLSFAGKGLKLDTEDDAKDIEREIFEFEGLEVLCLEGNTIGIDAAKAIARGLKKHPEFKRALWSDIFTGRLKTEIPPALKHFSGAMMTSGVKLVELDLSDNAFGPNGIEGVKDLLKSDTCYTLEVLKLNNNGLGTFGGKILATCLMECYDSSCKSGTPLGLKVFVSGRGRLENEGAKCLAAVFKKMGTLEHVAMPQNGIQYPGIIELSDAFAHCKNLMHLNLNDNTFTVEGARAMAKALPKLQSLQILNFGDCLIRTEGVVLLSQALKDGHEVLREVILCGNEIKKEGGVSVASILCNKKSLQKVELGANNFGEDGVNEIKSLFKAHKLDAVLDSLDDDEGSDLDEEEDEDDDSDEESEKDDVQVVEADTANIEEDPLVTNEVSSHLSAVQGSDLTAAIAVPKLAPLEDDKLAPLEDDKLAPLVDDELAPLVDEVLAPLEDDELAPLVDEVLASLGDEILAPLDELAPLVDEVLGPLVDKELGPLEDEVLAPLVDDELAPLLYDKLAPLEDDVPVGIVAGKLDLRNDDIADSNTTGPTSADKGDTMETDAKNKIAISKQTEDKVESATPVHVDEHHDSAAWYPISAIDHTLRLNNANAICMENSSTQDVDDVAMKKGDGEAHDRGTSKENVNQLEAKLANLNLSANGECASEVQTPAQDNDCRIL